MKCLHRLMHPADGTILGGFGDFRRWGIVGGSGHWLCAFGGCTWPPWGKQILPHTPAAMVFCFTSGTKHRAEEPWTEHSETLNLCAKINLSSLRLLMTGIWSEKCNSSYHTSSLPSFPFFSLSLSSPLLSFIYFSVLYCPVFSARTLKMCVCVFVHR
jgi:hypothetical protein